MVDDIFGVRQIYPDKAGGEKLFLIPNSDVIERLIYDSTGGKLEYQIEGDFYYISPSFPSGEELRVAMPTSDGYKQSITSLDHEDCRDKGYMATSKDFRNVEITWYIYTDQSLNERMTIFARTGKHLGNPRRCEGCAYKAGINTLTGKTGFKKEQWHTNQVSLEEKDTLAIGALGGKWIGFKFCLFNINNGLNVKGEIWIDKTDTNTWQLADSFIDSGGLGNQGANCGGNADQIITWGGPLIWFNLENTSDKRIKKISIREIDISLMGDNTPDPNPNPPPPAPPGTNDPPPTTTSTAYATLKGVYNINFDETDGCSGLAVDVPPLSPIYTVANTHDIKIDDDRDIVGLITHDNHETSAIESDKSMFIGKKIRRIELYLKKYGGPTGIATVSIRKASDNSIVTTMGEVDVTTLSASFSTIAFENLANSYRMQKDDKIVIHFAGGTDAAHIVVGINKSDPIDGIRTCLVRREPSPSAYYVEDTTYDLAGIIYI